MYSWRTLDSFPSKKTKEDHLIEMLFKYKMTKFSSEWYLLRDLQKASPHYFKIMDESADSFLLRIERPIWNGNTYYYDYKVEFQKKSEKYYHFKRVFSLGTADGVPVLVAEFMDLYRG